MLDKQPVTQLNIRIPHALALKLYAEGKVTKTRAAEIAELSVWEIVDLVEKHGLRWDYSLEDAKEEIAAVVKQTRKHKR